MVRMIKTSYWPFCSWQVFNSQHAFDNGVVLTSVLADLQKFRCAWGFKCASDSQEHCASKAVKNINLPGVDFMNSFTVIDDNIGNTIEAAKPNSSFCWTLIVWYKAWCQYTLLLCPLKLYFAAASGVWWQLSIVCCLGVWSVFCSLGWVVTTRQLLLADVLVCPEHLGCASLAMLMFCTSTIRRLSAQRNQLRICWHVLNC